MPSTYPIGIRLLIWLLCMLTESLFTVPGKLICAYAVDAANSSPNNVVTVVSPTIVTIGL